MRTSITLLLSKSSSLQKCGGPPVLDSHRRINNSSDRHSDCLIVPTQGHMIGHCISLSKGGEALDWSNYLMGPTNVMVTRPHYSRRPKRVDTFMNIHHSSFNQLFCEMIPKCLSEKVQFLRNIKFLN